MFRVRADSMEIRGDGASSVSEVSDGKSPISSNFPQIRAHPEIQGEKILRAAFSMLRMKR